MNDHEITGIEELYPDYTPEERTEANETIQRYLSLIWRIYSRLRQENPKKLTKALLNARFKRPRA